jgi:c-di-GMP-binding flagellar brake protein YcgR
MTLRGIAERCGMDPIAVFTSRDRLDTCIKRLANEAGHSRNGKISQEFLFKLYDYRKKLEIVASSERKAFSNTCQLKAGQSLQISADGIVDFGSQIIKNASNYMTVSRPVNDQTSSVKDWRGLEISVSFWADGDAGYAFDTTVHDEVYSLGIYSLKIAHSFSLSRVQQRKSIRTKVNVPAFLYLVREGEPFHKVESVPGVRCMLEDLSDTGYALTVGGSAENGLRIKVQFELNGAAVCMSGTVRSMVYRADTDRSILRVEADSMPIRVRNQIMGKIFGIISAEHDTHFSTLDEEAVSIAAAGTQETTNPDYEYMFNGFEEEFAESSEPVRIRGAFR